SQLIGFLGGARGVAFTDAEHTHPYPPIDYVLRDRVAHDGHRHRNDPRVGMVGGSYGGEIQFAAADQDPRLDAIVPMITWNDLSYSLTPNNTDFVHGVTSVTPGVPKFEWASLFFALGIADGLQGFTSDPSRDRGCPNFNNQVCKSYATSAALGYPTADTTHLLRHASAASYMNRIRIPTLLIQGEDDTLFDLQEAAATFRALRAQHTPVKMIWQSWGHSSLSPQPGEFASDQTVFQTYEGRRIEAWFDRYLKGERVDTGPTFAYYRSWIPYDGHGADDEQYGWASRYPLGSSSTWFLSGSNGLVSARARVQPGTAYYTSAPAGPPTSYSETSFVQSYLSGEPPPTDVPGTYVAYTTAPLSAPVTVLGAPRATLHLSAPSVTVTQLLGPTGMLQLYAKIYDIAPDGSVDLVHRLVSPVRVGDVTKPVDVELPGIVHRFAAGHRIEFVIAASDSAYKNSYWPQPVGILTGPSDPSTLTLPVVG
ncbi:MAG TPA: CocE/NonD family hydrolase, partial [Actinomycetota bacterium]